jgi:CheY-like chemotaxis protein/HPt (histidine-containing phosphotransfer) domain-containing protein
MDLTPNQRESLLMVRESGESLLTVINDILDFSKIEVGKLTLEHDGFDFRESLGDTMKSLAFRAHAKGLEIAYEAAPDIPATLTGDRNRLRQVVTNLVGNAIKFTNEGEVVLSVEMASRSDHQIELHFAVADTGMGVPEHKFDVIFDAFEQVDSSSTRQHGGTGLGLAIASNLVQLMGGRIWVESASDAGTTMHFTVRFDVTEDAPPVPQRAELAQLQQTRVLVVDDNATSRRILGQSLTQWQMCPTAVASGKEAWEALVEAGQQGDPYPLVLCDATMPRVDGFTLARRIDAQPELATSLLMMLTSTNQFEDIARCEKLGIAYYLVKPVKQSDLFDTIVLALGIRMAPRADQPEAPPSPELPPLEILLVEDSLVNQRLAVGLLEKYGHRVTVVHNGKEAIAITEDRPFDVVLMDVQMPEMDGLEATAIVRAREKQAGGHIPIVAMTAHVMKGDRDRCIEAGMDEYVPKPIEARTLLTAIAEALGRGTEAAAPPAEPADAGPAAAEPTDTEPQPVESADPGLADTEGPVDWTKARQTVQGDDGLLRVVMSTFLEELPGMMDAIGAAAAAQDADRLRNAAHTLKGTLGYCAAGAAYEAAYQLEMMAAAGEMERVEEGLARLEQEIARVKPVLLDYL